MRAKLLQKNTVIKIPDGSELDTYQQVEEGVRSPTAYPRRQSLLTPCSILPIPFSTTRLKVSSKKARPLKKPC